MGFAKLAFGLLRLRLGQAVPVSVTLELTHRCVAHCSYCPNVRNPRSEMSTREVLDAIDELSAAGLARLGLTGGEALLREDLPEVIAHAVRRGLYVSVNSNGMLVQGLSDRLRGAHALVLSLNGDRASHEATKEGTRHEAVLSAISWALAEGLDVVTITTLTRRNLEEIPYVLNLARRRGFWATFQPVVQCGTQDRLPDGLALTDEELRRAATQLLRARRDGYPVANSVHHLRSLLAAAEGRPRVARPCPLVAGACTILPDGTLVPCQLVRPGPEHPNGRSTGFLRAFRTIPVPLCDALCPGPYDELAALFAWRPWAIANAVRVAGSRRIARWRAR